MDDDAGSGERAEDAEGAGPEQVPHELAALALKRFGGAAGGYAAKACGGADAAGWARGGGCLAEGLRSERIVGEGV
jgi:hypothetical protein